MRKPPKDDALPEASVPPDTLREWAALLADSRVAQAFRRLQRKLQQLASRLEDERERADNAAELIRQLLELMLGVPDVPRRTWRRRSPEEHGVMKAEATAGVSSLQIKRQFDGSGEVSVNGRRSFRLPPKLCELLAVLSAAGPCADDELLGWQTTSAVATALNEKTGGRLSPTAVPKLVYKLRKEFRKAGENWLLIKADRTFGVRVAVRARPGAG